MSIRVLFLFTPLALQGLWLLALIEFPAVWRDREGYNALTAMMLLSAALGILGLSLLVAAGIGKVSWYFAGAVLAAPVFHLAGATSPEWLAPFFWLLSLLGLCVATVWEARSRKFGG